MIRDTTAPAATAAVAGDVSAVVLVPAEGDPHKLLAPGAPIACGDIPGWVVCAVDGMLWLAMDVRCLDPVEEPVGGYGDPVKLLVHDPETWPDTDLPPIALRLAWGGEAVAEGVDRWWRAGRDIQPYNHPTRWVSMPELLRLAERVDLMGGRWVVLGAGGRELTR